MARYSLLNTSLIVATVATVGVTHAHAATTLKTDQDKVSYVIGYQIGSNFKRDGLEVDLNMLTNGLKEALAGEKSPLTQEETQKLMADLDKNLRAKAEAQRKAAGEKNATEGKNYLTENFRKPGIKKTASGLQYKVIAEGKGDAPKADDTVSVNYKGTLINGTEFDSSYKRGQPAKFPVSGVIKGWTEALQLMKPGAKYQLFIPSELAYGDRGAGPLIGPNATLIFDVELLSVEPKATAAAAPAGTPTEKK
ncbi:MAG: FKBP-type peptidyl-prolyl cis-trans isomerase [Deltaproteobacteria bacterium]|nr:FKBP-type peptidyl-prolyl cis-trans isomerase [Deltaproteobacteria bacterium]